MQNINRNQFQAFPYHLVTQSPWPLLLSWAIFSMAIGAVMSFHGFNYGPELLNLGLILTVSGMVLWFRDITIEGTYLGDHTKQVQKGLTLGVALFIVSEAFAFLSVFWAFFHSSLAPTIEIGQTWPPLGITALDPFAIPSINTVLLLSSGATITYGHHALIKGDRKAALIGCYLTVLLAIIFTVLQYVEYTTAGFTIADSVFGSVFFASTGLHGFHVIIGTLFISVGLFRVTVYHLTKGHHLGLESAIIYWHFVDVVWIFLFCVVYYWGS